MPMLPAATWANTMVSALADGSPEGLVKWTAALGVIQDMIKSATVLPTTAGSPTLSVVCAAPGSPAPVIGTGSIT